MKKYKVTVDILMTLSLLMLMSYNLISDIAHEITGTIIALLFIIHHILNKKWTKSIFKGKYTPFRFLQTVMAVLVFLTMLMQIISGIVLSKYVFNFLNFDGLTGIARTIHILGAYWGFVFTSLHLGIHWNTIINPVMSQINKKSKAKQFLFALPAFLIAVYGAYSFVTQDIADYMFLRSQFVFFDFSKPLIMFFADYISIMGLFVFIGYYLSKTLKISKRKRS